MRSQPTSYHGYRFPPDIISHAVWLYHTRGVRRIAVGLPGLGDHWEGSVRRRVLEGAGLLIVCQHALLLVHDPVPVEDRAARVPGEEPRPSFRDTRSSQGPPGVTASGAPSRRPPALVPDDRATVGSVWPMAAPVAGRQGWPILCWLRGGPPGASRRCRPRRPSAWPVGGELLLSPQSVEIIKFGDPGSGR